MPSSSSQDRSPGFPPYTSSAATQENGTPAVTARPIIFCASAGLVANPTSSPIPAAPRRPRSLVQFSGRYSSRSISARDPAGVLIPRREVQQPLQPVRRHVPGELRQRPPVLPLRLRQQPQQIRPAVPAHRRVGEVPGDLRE